MHKGLALVAVAALAACEPTVPDSAVGVGFSSYESYEAERVARENALSSSQTTLAPVSAPVISSEELSAAGLPTATASTSGSTATTQVPSTTDEIVTLNHPGISDEQDFQAVASRETIESDRERLEANAANYVVIQPTAVPDRPGSTTPNIVAYALSTTNSVGEPLYHRSFASAANALARAQRLCAAYASPDLAQIAFLEAGGPQKDRKGLDPDGDGFACSWDPAPFRLAYSATSSSTSTSD